MFHNQGRATVALNLRIDPVLKTRLQALAMREQRSLWAFIEEALCALTVNGEENNDQGSQGAAH
jgi:predicted transcriptional regulator